MVMASDIMEVVVEYLTNLWYFKKIQISDNFSHQLVSYKHLNSFTPSFISYDSINSSHKRTRQPIISVFEQGNMDYYMGLICNYLCNIKLLNLFYHLERELLTQRYHTYLMHNPWNPRSMRKKITYNDA